MGTNRPMFIQHKLIGGTNLTMFIPGRLEWGSDRALLEEIPFIFHPYIAHIQNVLGDVNCGFRSVVICLDMCLYILQQLLDELLSSYEDYARVFVGCDERVLKSLGSLHLHLCTPIIMSWYNWKESIQRLPLRHCGSATNPC
uniref:Uncharacterized protein n=1 Tax=Lactuca sativa TaxID=4236 RepID=A0A9R1VJZ3_LACSA|nr:hypothetical protein LSAT_V11C500245910 [Lactuca sativa]